MNVPTEPGWYWWQMSPTVEPMPMSWPIEGPLLIAIFGGDHPATVAEWGERIPDSDTLKARRELAARYPWASADVVLSLDAFGGPNPSKGCRTSFGRAICIYCGAQVYGGDCNHTPDCPWLRAQEKRDA